MWDHSNETDIGQNKDIFIWKTFFVTCHLKISTAYKPEQSNMPLWYFEYDPWRKSSKSSH